MISINILLFLGTFSIIHGERWYSATVIETDKPFKPTVFREFRKSQEDNFYPIDERLALEENIATDRERWHFMKRKSDKHHLQQIDPLPHTKGLSKKYNLTEGTTVIRLGKIKKRCPEVCSRTKSLKSNQNKTRFLEVFQVVEFDHVPCISSSGLEGTCFHEYECQSSGGTGMGTCADGYGTCCVTLLPCDSESAASVGWFTNPDFPLPSNDRMSCAIALNKASEEVTQIRLDFMTFELLPPTAGVCQDDQFIVSGQNVNSVIPILCGINTGQHIYVEVGETEGPIYISIQTANPENRLFSIKVTQLTSAEDLVAPGGCLQYFTEPKGYLESLNYRDTSDIGIARRPSYYNNLNYAICIQRAAGSCSVTYTNAGYTQIVNYDTDGLPVIPPGQAGVEIFNCPSDWLLIAATRLCGDRLNDGSVLQDFSLNAPVTDNSAGPIVVWFRSDEGYVGRGFRLQYEQSSCTST